MSISAKMLANNTLGAGDFSPQIVDTLSFGTGIDFVELDDYFALVQRYSKNNINKVIIFKKSTSTANGKYLGSVPINVSGISAGYLGTSTITISKSEGNSIIVCYSKSAYTAAKVIKITDDIIEIGSEYVVITFGASATYGSSVISCSMSSGKCLVLSVGKITSGDANNIVRACIISSSGLVVSAGTVTAVGTYFSPTSKETNISCCRISNNSACCLVTGLSLIYPISISGNNITVGTGVSISSSESTCKMLSKGDFIYLFQNANTTNTNEKNKVIILNSGNLTYYNTILLDTWIISAWSTSDTVYFSTLRLNGNISYSNALSYVREPVVYNSTSLTEPDFVVNSQKFSFFNCSLNRTADSYSYYYFDYSGVIIGGNDSELIFMSGHAWDDTPDKSFYHILQYDIDPYGALIPYTKDALLITGQSGKNIEISSIYLTSIGDTNTVSIFGIVGLFINDELIYSLVLDSSIIHKIGQKSYLISLANNPIIIQEGFTLTAKMLSGTTPCRITAFGLEETV